MSAKDILKGKKVLAIDDEPDILETISDENSDPVGKNNTKYSKSLLNQKSKLSLGEVAVLESVRLGTK